MPKPRGKSKIDNMERDDGVTPEQTYLNRRTFMRAGVLVATTLATATVYRRLNRVGAGNTKQARIANVIAAPTTGPSSSGFTTTETRTPLTDITHYNNFYEFSTDKEAVAEAAANFIS